jgi:hypothetical protein
LLKMKSSSASRRACRCVDDARHISTRSQLARSSPHELKIVFVRRKLSHDFGPTEIEGYFNCHSFRSFLISPRTQDGKYYLSVFRCLIYWRALADNRLGFGR